MSESPATPRPAATILLLRHGGPHAARGVAVLLGRRPPTAPPSPGARAPPGGVIAAAAPPAACAPRDPPAAAGGAPATHVELVAWSRWITPEIVPVRFDTHFFVARAEPHTKPQPDLTEVTDADWFAPRAALDAHEAGELELVFPTVKTLETLVSHPTAEAVIETARMRRIEPIVPRVVGTRADHRIVLPWEDGYEDAVTDPGKLAP